MAVIFMVVAWGLLWRLCVQRGQERREAVITASLAWGVLVVALTEALSLLHALSFAPMALAWGCVCLGLFALLRRSAHSLPSPADQSLPMSRIEWLYMGVISVIIPVTGITALVAPPNTWDSMTYHMTRVAFWAQNGSIAHFPTNNIRQLLFPPFAEYAILHTYLLSGGDHAANLVQWFSMIGSLVVVSLLARDLGARRQGQWLAAVFCATLPMGILQASSTQNDYVVTFWLLCLTWLILKAARQRLTWGLAVQIGVGIGLALLTKATAYVYIVTLALALGLIVLWQWRWRLWQVSAVMAVCAVLLTGTFYLRNVQSFGGLFGSSQSQGESFNAEISPRVVLSNLLRNTAMHLMIAPNRLNDTLGFQQKVQAVIEALHQPLGLSPSDSRTTFGTQTFAVPIWNTNEDLAGNPLHLLLFVAALCLFAANASQRRNRWMLLYLLMLAGHLLVFCALLRWMTWISRFHLFPFALMMAFAAVMLSQRRFYTLVLPLLILISLGPLFLNETRAWMGKESIFSLPREQQYFVAVRQMGQEMRQAAAVMSGAGCDQIGVGAGTDQWVYPLFRLLSDRPSLRIEYINHEDYPLGPFTPCGLIVYRGFARDVAAYAEAHGLARQEMALTFFDVYLKPPQQ